MYSDDKKNFIFFHNPKCAGTTVYSLFDYRIGRSKINARSKLTQRLYHQYKLRFRETVNYWKPFDPWHANYEMIKNALPSLNLNKYFKFCFIRNPYTKLYSTFREFTDDQTYRKYWPIPENFTFSDYVYQQRAGSAPANMPSNYFFTHYEDKLIMDFIGRFENFEEDLKKICDMLQLPFIKKENRNISKHIGQNYLDFYTSNLIKFVNDNYAKDFDTFGYTKLDPKNFPLIHTKKEIK